MKTEVAAAIQHCSGQTTEVQAQLYFPAELEVFTGHFPDHPMVPGIYLIEAARQLLERCAATRLQIAGVEDARFTGEVHPEATVKVYGQQRGEGLWELQFETTAGPAARIRLRVHPPSLETG